MIKHIFKTIWNERKINAWIIIELILVFSILWFCVDYLFFAVKRYSLPKGFDIEHTYRIHIETDDEGKKILNSDNDDDKQKMLTDMHTIFDRIEKYPAVEYISISSASYPYSGSWSSSSFTFDSTEVSSVQIKEVTPGFFEVFKTNIIKGVPFTWENIVNEDVVIISAGKDNMFGEESPEQIKQVSRGKDFVFKVIGVANRVKRSELQEYNTILYRPIKKDELQTWTSSGRELCIRIKPEADKNFIEQFTKDMENQLGVGHYSFTGITPLSKDRDNYFQWNGFSDNFKSIYSIAAFLIINIFLGVIGTFWFRVQSRRSEIGLRIALGSSKAGVKKIFVIETFILLFLASVVASVICVNVAMADLLKELSVPIPDRREEVTGYADHAINYILTLSFLAIISFIAVWYPAKRASNIQPSEALKDE